MNSTHGGGWVTGAAFEIMRSVGPNADGAVPLVGGPFSEGDELLIALNEGEPPFVGVLVVRPLSRGPALRVASKTNERNEYWFYWNHAVGWRRPK